MVVVIWQLYWSNLEKRSLISKFQFGYQPNCSNRSTQQATILLPDEIRFEENDNKLVGALLLDLSKTFDTISHSVLLNKLKAYDINNEELEWFASYLFYTSQVVDINNKRSNDFYIYSGVPPGSILGPLLFLIFFNDFPDAFKKSKVLMYADDTVIYYAHSDINVIERVLSEEMCYLSRYFYQNKLILNLKEGKT